MDNKRKVITGFGGNKQSITSQQSSEANKVIEAGITETRMLDELMASLKQDSLSYEDFERKIARELKDVKGMENNAMHIQSQVEVMKRLLSTREGIAKRIMYESNKIGDVDVKYFETLFTTLSKIDDELRSNIRLAKEELSKLFLTQKDLLYLEEGNRNMMNNISNLAKQLDTEITVIIGHQGSLHDELLKIYNIMMEKKKQNQI